MKTDPDSIVKNDKGILKTMGNANLHEDIQKAGANARAIGISEIDNPYYKTEAMPACTGETVQKWQEKATAWQLGWNMEDAMRTGSSVKLRYPLWR